MRFLVSSSLHRSSLSSWIGSSLIRKVRLITPYSQPKASSACYQASGPVQAQGPFVQVWLKRLEVGKKPSRLFFGSLPTTFEVILAVHGSTSLLQGSQVTEGLGVETVRVCVVQGHLHLLVFVHQGLERLEGVARHKVSNPSVDEAEDNIAASISVEVSEKVGHTEPEHKVSLPLFGFRRMIMPFRVSKLAKVNKIPAILTLFYSTPRVSPISGASISRTMRSPIWIRYTVMLRVADCTWEPSAYSTHLLILMSCWYDWPCSSRNRVRKGTG
ncbi:hypothetical protein CONLIGDRAFT_322333 [Coniochaeta ligniaria NRRL 30616]|uniref:Uncharacterized protein n=1 Tax=Coniochaeta ligniaria NRRL 30616 TaxID=1408157 RepID=A0A1J7IP27_9PEZI|nr:hypothetical protein CONLIGDRAFT_322333 [Coniochaeta ligniaria NRRL 30616]